MMGAAPTGQALPRMRRLADVMVWGGFNWQVGAAATPRACACPCCARPAQTASKSALLLPQVSKQEADAPAGLPAPAAEPSASGSDSGGGGGGSDSGGGGASIAGGAGRRARCLTTCTPAQAGWERNCTRQCEPANSPLALPLSTPSCNTALRCTELWFACCALLRCAAVLAVGVGAIILAVLFAVLLVARYRRALTDPLSQAEAGTAAVGAGAGGAADGGWGGRGDLQCMTQAADALCSAFTPCGTSCPCCSNAALERCLLPSPSLPALCA